MTEREREDPTVVYAEFRAFLNDMAGAQTHAEPAVDRYVSWLQEMVSNTPPNPDNPDPTIFVGVGDPNLSTTRTYQEWKVSQLREKGSFTKRWIGQQWIAGVFAGWEEEYRPRLARAFGCPASALRHEALGDLRLMRNDVVHHRGVASESNTGQCRLLRWFVTGEAISVKGEHVAEFMQSIPTTLSPS
ncbi:MAG: hypothetical protein JJE46_07355 [Acidimicrobiia bacterium]|nr:hypothetical protein [Acidimicrobiia bacterium]